MNPPDALELIEIGRGRSKAETCTRDHMGHVRDRKAKSECQPHRVFHSSTDAAGTAGKAEVPLSEALMQHAILDGGPIVVGFDTYDDFGKFDGKGAYSKKTGARRRGGHAIVLFGWGEDSGGKFWWAKNSYGATWPKATIDMTEEPDETLLHP